MPDQKAEIVYKHPNNHSSENIGQRVADRKWVKTDIIEGESSFVHNGRIRTTLYIGKDLSEVERLQLMVANLGIGKERVKKEYAV